LFGHVEDKCSSAIAVFLHIFVQRGLGRFQTYGNF
jgi:hypothetical protein